MAEQWRSSFKEFLTHIGPLPSVEHQLDRINNDGNYEPGNVRWATRKEQSRNRSDNRWVDDGEERLVITDMAHKYGVTKNVLNKRIKAGVPLDVEVIPERINRYLNMEKNDLIRFFNYVDKTPTCWIWKGADRFRVDGHLMKINRASWALLRGPLDRDQLVNISCGEPRCVNPDHMTESSRSDISKESIKVAHEWHRQHPELERPRLVGQTNGRAKLSDEQVLDLRSKLEKKSKSELAGEFGISLSQVYRIASGIRSEPKSKRKPR